MGVDGDWRIGHNVLHADQGSQMIYQIDLRNQVIEQALIQYRVVQKVEPVAFEVLLDIGELPGREVIDGEHLITTAEQTVNQGSPELPSAAGHEDLHRFDPSCADRRAGRLAWSMEE